MLVVETIARIRREHLVNGKGLKRIARELGLSRNTVRRVLRSGATAFSYERERQPRPRLGGFVERLEGLLAENAGQPRRARLRLWRIYELLRAAGYAGGYDAVRRYAQRWRRAHAALPAAVYVPLRFAPGEAYQFDWSQEQVELGGVPQTVKVAHLRLCHSRAFLAVAYPRETQEMVFDGHDRAFAFLGGACRKGIYDNMKTAVDAVFVGKERKFNRRFVQMCAHYLVEPVACTPAAGWEKGQVENQVGTVRERLFKPRLKFATLVELNHWLADQCLAWAKANRHPEFTERTVWEVWQEERAALIACPGPFDGYREVEAAVSPTCLVNFERNRYSVDCAAAGRPVQLRVYAERVAMWLDGKRVGEHARQFGRGRTVYDPWHYVPVLARKPGALRNGAPFQDWALPPGLGEVRRRLTGHDDGDRQFVAILAAVREDGLETVETACAGALAAGICGADVILNILARRRSPPPSPSLATPAQLRLTVEPIADCARYDGLRRPPSPGADHAAP